MAAFQWVCRRCARGLRAPQEPWAAPQRRHLHDRWLQRQYAAELEWKNQAVEIRGGTRKGMLAVLEERGFVNQTTG
jgi:tyrosyl-tRNA synthetase